MAGRRIINEQDARQCLAAAKSFQAGLAEWSRAHGVDGRSLSFGGGLCVRSPNR